VFLKKIQNRDVSGKSQIGKSAVFRFSGRRKDISGKSGKKFPGKSDVFGGNFPKIPNPKIPKFGKFRKKIKTSILKIQPSFAERFKTHFKS
jgi:hypothetical protein